MSIWKSSFTYAICCNARGLAPVLEDTWPGKAGASAKDGGKEGAKEAALGSDKAVRSAVALVSKLPQTISGHVITL
jgi:hypothetical protein